MRHYRCVALLVAAAFAGCTYVTEVQDPPPGPAPVDPGPVDPGPVDPGPVDPGPVDPGPAPGPQPGPQHGPPPWVGNTVSATGFGAPRADQPPGQARLNAQRAARMDALRKISEQLNGLQLDSRTSVRDFVTENDEVASSTQAFLSGMRETDVQQMPDGTVSVTLEVSLRDYYRKVIQPHWQP